LDVVIGRKARKHRESVYQELVRKYISKKYGCVTVRELNFGGPKFDVVGFSPDTGEFHIAECKRSVHPVGVGQTFGQILAYKSMIYDAGETFLSAFEKHLLKGGVTNIPFWTHAAQFVETGKIPVRFYVALRDSACERPEFLRLMKRDLRDVGIIRINKYGQCKDYVHAPHGRKDFELCQATTVEVPIAAPVRPVLRRILDHQSSSPSVVELTAKVDSRILKMSRKVISVPRRPHCIFYRAGTNFVGLYPKKEFLSVRIREKKRWKLRRIKTKAQLPALFSRVREAMARSLEG
jgi:hypothetical protein